MASDKPQGRQRADVCVVAQGLAPSRAQAHALILAGVILRADNAERIDKPGTPLAANVVLVRKGAPMPYVSRGGLKLQAALQHFGVDPTERTCLDVGASTGGFTDCLLQAGARRVYAVDVGTNQLAWQLRKDARVISREQCNMRTAAPDFIPERVSLVVADVSFISICLVLPAAVACLVPGGDVVVLVKPQFEVGRAAISKGGIVRSPEARQAALDGVASQLPGMGLRVFGTMPSPIVGAKGNHEFLLHAQNAK
jgi:23S rRNA (cytidine1920-2'-O)/16S rRNA (cytidine1409-2'-O)-methyltransferase